MSTPETIRKDLRKIGHRDSDMTAAEEEYSARYVGSVRKAADDSMAADATASGADGTIYVPYKCRVVKVAYIPDAGSAVTAHATNFATLQLKVGSTVVADRATDTVTTDDQAAMTVWALNLSTTASNTTIAAGSALGLAITKDGSGVVVDSGDLHVWAVPVD